MAKPAIALNRKEGLIMAQHPIKVQRILKEEPCLSLQEAYAKAGVLYVRGGDEASIDLIDAYHTLLRLRLKEGGIITPALLCEKTGWGESLAQKLWEKQTLLNLQQLGRLIAIVELDHAAGSELKKYWGMAARQIQQKRQMAQAEALLLNWEGLTLAACLKALREKNGAIQCDTHHFPGLEKVSAHRLSEIEGGKRDDLTDTELSALAVHYGFPADNLRKLRTHPGFPEAQQLPEKTEAVAPTALARMLRVCLMLSGKEDGKVPGFSVKRIRELESGTAPSDSDIDRLAAAFARPYGLSKQVLRAIRKDPGLSAQLRIELPGSKAEAKPEAKEEMKPAVEEAPRRLTPAQRLGEMEAIFGELPPDLCVSLLKAETPFSSEEQELICQAERVVGYRLPDAMVRQLLALRQ